MRRGENSSEGEMMKKEVAVMKEVAFEQLIVLSLVTWVGWEMGKTEKVVNRKRH